MFTGLVEEIGTITHIRREGGSRLITVKASKVMSDLKIDNSINIDGACQTVIRLTDSTFTVQAVEETLQKATSGQLRIGDQVNLERALQMGARLGGHIVAGHVDCVGRVVNRLERTSSVLFSIQIESKWMRYVVEMGSIAVNGVSLTVARLAPDQFTVSIIPYTLDQTTLARLRPGDSVNIEVDILGKYVEKLMDRTEKEHTLTFDKLSEMGY